MDTPQDLAQDQWYSDLIGEISQEAIDQFALERLRSYYVANPELAVNAVMLFREAEEVLPTSPTAATVLFTTSIELCLKVALLKPIVYGLVHNQSVADLISDLAVKHNGLDRFKPLLAHILEEYGQIDFNAFTIEGHNKTLWEEITELQTTRNSIVHRGEPASLKSATLAKEVAAMLVGTYFVSVIEGLGLKYVKGGRIENA